jgi:hypothetical protein
MVLHDRGILGGYFVRWVTYGGRLTRCYYYACSNQRWVLFTLKNPSLLERSFIPLTDVPPVYMQVLVRGIIQ